MNTSTSPSRKAVLAWALYDWANSAFACTVLAGFFPVFFKQYWSAGVSVTDSTFRLGVVNTSASMAIALLAPFLGALADAGHSRKSWLLACITLGIGGTAGLYFVGKGEWLAAALVFTLASVGWMGANTFYDSLLVFVAPNDSRDRVSALGYSLGYLGGGLLFAANVAMTLFPEALGLADKADAVRVSFLSVALWWAVFSIPLFRCVSEANSHQRRTTAEVLAEGARSLKHTFSEIRKLPSVYGFLIAYWLYIDGVDTIMRMAVDYGMSIGLSANHLITALLITQFVGFPSAIAFGVLGQKIGPKVGIALGIAVYAGVTVYAGFLKSAAGFYVLAIVVGLVQGGVQALSRSLYARLIPQAQTSEFFGFYNMLGKSAAIVGPVLMGVVGMMTGSPRWSVLSLLALFGLGGWFLARVNVAKGERDACEWTASTLPRTDFDAGASR